LEKGVKSKLKGLKISLKAVKLFELFINSFFGELLSFVGFFKN
jgi:hypothetical protein